MNEKNRKKALGTYTIAEICQVTPPTVGRWIADGKLEAFTTAGGHHRVYIQHLVEFLSSHNMSIPPELIPASSLKILIVDDDLGIRKYIEKIVSSSLPGVEIHEAKDGFEAGHKITALVPTLVILDLYLPGIDGFQVCKTIKQTENLNAIKVLAITGFGGTNVRRSIKESGADAFLEKPFEPEALVEEIKKLLMLRREK